jgi:predicted PurR-regulated permease PerM
MPFPSPTERQAKTLWFTLTALAVAISLALLGLVVGGIVWLLGLLSSVLLPLAVAGVIACLLDPAVDLLQARFKIPRTRAIVMVFFLGIMLLLILLSTIVPQVIYEVKALVDNLPGYAAQLRERVSTWLAASSWGHRAKAAWDADLGTSAQAWLTGALPLVTAWLLSQATKVASWAGLLAGFALVPVYVFYFLLEKEGITRNWRDYLPLKESGLKREVIFVISAINECLVVFFRGQVLVALCTGTLLTIGFLLLGLNYAVLLGVLAAVLGIIPYLGSMTCLVLALLVSLMQFQDWQHPLLMVVVFALAQLTEGLYVSPKIIGDRVGLHPLTIIIAVLVGTTVLGGILGGVLAIPLTAALRTLMFRYVWVRRKS